MSEKINFKFVDLDYQIKAVDSTVAIFNGQEKRMGNTIYRAPGSGEIVGRDIISNPRFNIPSTKIAANLRDIQIKNDHLLPDDTLLPGYNFTVDMETGTGKTYVYLRTILELNKVYGFTKFIIVVPSLAIKLGVWKSIQQLTETFKSLYDGLNLINHAFIYDSKNLGQLNSFIEDPTLSIVIMNIDQFNSSTNIIQKEKEGAKSYWDKLHDTKPILIIDEPQLIEGKAKNPSATLQKLEKLEPLFAIRYSATHRNPYNMIYKLTSYDAYAQHLVKQICVKTVYGDVPKDFPFIRYVSFNKDLTAKIEIFAKTDKGIEKEKFDVKDGSSLQELSRNLPQYENMFVMGNPHKLDGLTISRGKIGQLTLFDEKGSNKDLWGLTINRGADLLTLIPGDCTYNEVLRETDSTIVRVQIRLAIKNHLDKQFSLLEKGHEIKALSLFFIDEVKRVRGENGEDGIFLKIFDEEYQRLISEKKYQDYFKKYAKLFPDYKNVKNVREGYFAIDNGGKAVEPELLKKKSQLDLFSEDNYEKKSKEDIARGIDLILRKKEELISFDTSLAFIFSHSALREGWDNPNIFTLCTLKESSNEMAQKQEIGRGLRLPVDIHGNRCHDDDVNKLTVIANAYYEDFAKNLQENLKEKGMEKDVATEFEFFETLRLAGIPVEKLTKDLENEFKRELERGSVINASGKLSSSAQKFLTNLNFNNETLAEHAVAIKDAFIKLMDEKGTKKIHIENGDQEPEENTPHSYIKEKAFVDLVNELTLRLEKRTFYQINIDEIDFVETASRLVSKLLKQKSVIAQTITAVTGDVIKDKFGRTIVQVEAEDHFTDNTPLVWHKISDFQIINYIMSQTRLPRLAIYEILQNIDSNDREYLRMQDVLDTVSMELKNLLKEFKSNHVSGYHVIDNYLFDKKELFIPDKIDAETINELRMNESQTFDAYRTKAENRRAIYKYYKTDSKGEKEFAMQLDGDENVLLFTKLHKGGFVIDTPEGDYSPDWAVVYKHSDNNVRLYFVVETKIDKDKKDLSDVEKHKIEYGKQHFDAVATSIGKQVDYFYAKNYRDFKNKVTDKEMNTK